MGVPLLSPPLRGKGRGRWRRRAEVGRRGTQAGGETVRKQEGRCPGPRSRPNGAREWRPPVPVCGTRRRRTDPPPLQPSLPPFYATRRREWSTRCSTPHPVSRKGSTRTGGLRANPEGVRPHIFAQQGEREPRAAGVGKGVPTPPTSVCARRGHANPEAVPPPGATQTRLRTNRRASVRGKRDTPPPPRHPRP
ncbi:hypothetical protein EDB85DRAFT_1992042, partial [Lactarius pseudohatsudake]